MDETALRYDANKKSLGVSYIFWFLLGGFGAHRFYLDKKGSAWVMLLLAVAGFATVYVVVGAVLLALVGIWALIDAFLIPGMVRSYNNSLIDGLTARIA